MTVVDPHIFRAYDIRGIVGKQLNEDVFYHIGKGFSTQLTQQQKSTCFVGRDGRLSSDSLAKAMIQGLLDNGIHVIDLGLTATPLVYFATKTDPKVDSGVMITGSHNAAEYNGIKMVIGGETLAEGNVNAIYHAISRPSSVKTKGHYQTQDILAAYQARILADITLKRPLKVVVDAGNAAAGPIIPKLLKALGCEVIPLYCDIDGRFPNHHPDPTIASNLTALQAVVKKNRADIGLAFDGDADRLGVVTNEGNIICPDRLLMLYAQDILEKNTKETIVYDVKCSSHLEPFITNAGGIPHMCPTGHSIVKRIMKEKNAALAGEMSGHIFFKNRWYGFDDAMYSACRLLEILSHSTNSTEEQFQEIPTSVNTPELKIAIPEDQKFAFMERFRHEAQFQDATLITIDGVRAEFEIGWGLLRASNTSPYLIARFEADTEEGLALIQAQFKQVLLRLDAEMVVPF